MAFFAAAMSVPAFDGDPGTNLYVLAIAMQLISVGLSVALLVQLLFGGERAQWPAWGRWLMFVGGLTAIGLAWQLNLTRPWNWALHAVALCAVALPIGYWLGDRLERVSHLVPLCVAMTMADVFSVVQGPSGQIARQVASYQHEVARKAAEAAQQAPPAQAQQAAELARQASHAPLSDFLLAHLPLAGKVATAEVLGIGDFIAMAFLFRTAWVHGVNPRLMFGSVLVCVLGSLTLAQTTGLALPALPLICLGTLAVLLIADPRMRRIGRQELVLTVGVVLLFGALIASRWVLQR
jgi:hypothetical protein